MSIKIGFAVLSHDQPHQLLRLTTTLNAAFANAPIVCHHDFSKCAVEEKLFPQNVRFVRPHLVTRWGHISVPLAALRAFRLLMESDEPDWFVLLSGSDYPVRSADQIIDELGGSEYDAYLDCREILFRSVPPGQTARDGFGRPAWISLAYDRYFGVPLFWWPRLSKTLLLSGKFPLQKKYVFLRSPSVLRRLQPERPQHIYGGDFWFQANRKAIERLLNSLFLPELIRYFEHRWNVDESLFHTLLCNQADLRICKDHKRYEDWSSDGKHPKLLEVADVPKIMASGAHFARKFRPDGAVQDFIDENILGIRVRDWRHTAGAGLDVQFA
ncbi:MAG TPA: beta-1,6-N-acetylglucosaminyltransferase [Candidatus Acidoferrales bacterium]|nr:beta-1,6-N-acetylglucosaminyltransferase [Candidatus Acidoferrales bacterium]